MTDALRLPTSVYRCVQAAEQALRAEDVTSCGVLVAVSGGSDSMALLEIAGLLAPVLDLRLHVAWIDHRMRDGSGEGALVGQAASRLGAPFHREAIDPGRGDEATLRAGRYAALEAIAQAAGCPCVLLGHSADDQVETILMRLLRGAGLRGMAAMARRRGPFVRPLLGLRREQLRALLRERGLVWAEDPSNDSDRYARGRLRRHVLPAIAASFGAGALDHLLDVAAHWRRDAEFLEAETARALAWVSRRGQAGACELDREALATLHPAIRARVLMAWIYGATGTACGARHVSALLEWLDGPPAAASGLDLPACRVEGDNGRIRIARAPVADKSRVAAPERPC